MKKLIIILFALFLITEIVWEVLWLHYPEMKLLRHCFNFIGGVSIWSIFGIVATLRK